jgi:hypothetical protein
MNSILTHSFSSKDSTASISFEAQHIRVKFTLHHAKPNSNVQYVASASAGRNNSFTGSALPYPSEEIAFDNTPFKGNVMLQGTTGEIILDDLPNSYYVKLGSLLIPPAIKLSYLCKTDGSQKITYIVLCDSIPYRTLTYDYRRSSPGFYDVDLPVRSQEQVLRDSAYDPTYDVRKSFWALRPPF